MCRLRGGYHRKTKGRVILVYTRGDTSMKNLKIYGTLIGAVSLILNIFHIIPNETFLSLMVTSIFIIVTCNEEEVK